MDWKRGTILQFNSITWQEEEQQSRHDRLANTLLTTRPGVRRSPDRSVVTKLFLDFTAPPLLRTSLWSDRFKEFEKIAAFSIINNIKNLNKKQKSWIESNNFSPFHFQFSSCTSCTYSDFVSQVSSAVIEISFFRGWCHYWFLTENDGNYLLGLYRGYPHPCFETRFWIADLLSY